MKADCGSRNAESAVPRKRVVRMKGAVCFPGPKSDRFDLGLAIAHATCAPGVRRTQEEIAAFCECDRRTIWTIERRALQKLRKLTYTNRELFAEFGEFIGTGGRYA